MKQIIAVVVIGFISLSANATTFKILSNYSPRFDSNTQKLILDDGDYTVEHVATIKLPNGLIKNKYTQTYRGIPSLNSVLTSSEKSGKQGNWQGILVKKDFQVVPRFDKKTILSMAKDAFKIKGIAKNETTNLFIRLNEKNDAQLIYLVSFILEDSQIYRPYFMFNAISGKLMHSWDGLTTRQARGPGGNGKTGRYEYGRDFDFLNVSDDCSMSNDQVETYDMQNKTSGGILHRFICPINNSRPVNGAYSPLNDGHYSANLVIGMYQNWYALNPLNKKLKVYVHFGQNQVHAHWDGEKIVFGDGDALTFYPLTSLDIMAHEVSHAVTERYSKLLYWQQSGGINEAFSDMAGEVAKAYMNQQNDWLVGATVFKANSLAMRYFSNPSLDGHSIAHVRDFHSNMDPHYSSGIFNKAFYVLTNKPNWNIRKAFSIFLLANQIYWTPESTFDSAACGVTKAASDRGLSTQEINDVIQSFSQVGVVAKCPESSH